MESEKKEDVGYVSISGLGKILKTILLYIKK